MVDNQYHLDTHNNLLFAAQKYRRSTNGAANYYHRTVNKDLNPNLEAYYASHVDPLLKEAEYPKIGSEEHHNVIKKVISNWKDEDVGKDILKDELSLPHKEDGGGITAYHGSPHDFDQFDSSKIGTGEGAQAYGHGLYFAEHEPVAKGYRDALTDEVVHINGKRVAPPTQEDPSTEHIYRLANNMYQLGHTADQAIDYALRNSEKLEPNLSHPDYYKRMEAEKAKKWSETILPFRKKTIEWKKDLGHMYEIHIDAHPDHFLDWDKPLSEQSDHVRNALKGYLKYLGNKTGEDFYHHVKNGSGSDAAEASKFLSDRGIHGVKYLDAGSRGAGAGTRNYVVFDHNRVNVKRKYEQGGSVRRAYKKGGKVEGSVWSDKDVYPRGLANSEIVQHALDKIAASLPASMPLSGSATGRRR
jgi:hypothetical protein